MNVLLMSNTKKYIPHKRSNFFFVTNKHLGWTFEWGQFCFGLLKHIGGLPENTHEPIQWVNTLAFRQGTRQSITPQPLKIHANNRKSSPNILVETETSAGHTPKTTQSHKNIFSCNGMPCWMYMEEQVAFWKTSKHMHEIQMWLHYLFRAPTHQWKVGAAK